MRDQKARALVYVTGIASAAFLSGVESAPWHLRLVMMGATVFLSSKLPQNSVGIFAAFGAMFAFMAGQLCR